MIQILLWNFIEVDIQVQIVKWSWLTPFFTTIYTFHLFAVLRLLEGICICIHSQLFGNVVQTLLLIPCLFLDLWPRLRLLWGDRKPRRDWQRKQHQEPRGRELRQQFHWRRPQKVVLVSSLDITTVNHFLFTTTFGYYVSHKKFCTDIKVDLQNNIAQ